MQTEGIETSRPRTETRQPGQDHTDPNMNRGGNTNETEHEQQAKSNSIEKANNNKRSKE
jgi:hypothetical protein